MSGLAIGPSGVVPQWVRSRVLLSGVADAGYWHPALAIAIIIVAFILLATTGLVLMGRWLTRSWEVLDDDVVDVQSAGAFWFRLRGWFGRGPPRLTYRRDSRGRFRRHRR